MLPFPSTLPDPSSSRPTRSLSHFDQSFQTNLAPMLPVPTEPSDVVTCPGNWYAHRRSSSVSVHHSFTGPSRCTIHSFFESSLRQVSHTDSTLNLGIQISMSRLQTTVLMSFVQYHPLLLGYIEVSLHVRDHHDLHGLAFHLLQLQEIIPVCQGPL